MLDYELMRGAPIFVGTNSHSNMALALRNDFIRKQVRAAASDLWVRHVSESSVSPATTYDHLPHLGAV